MTSDSRRRITRNRPTMPATRSLSDGRDGFRLRAGDRIQTTWSPASKSRVQTPGGHSFQTPPSSKRTSPVGKRPKSQKTRPSTHRRVAYCLSGTLATDRVRISVSSYALSKRGCISFAIHQSVYARCPEFFFCSSFAERNGGHADSQTGHHLLFKIHTSFTPDRGQIIFVRSCSLENVGGSV